MDLRYEDLRPGLHALGVHRGVLFGALHEAVAEAGVPVHAGVRIAARRGGVLTDADGNEHGPYDLVVAADGARTVSLFWSVRADRRAAARAAGIDAPREEMIALAPRAEPVLRNLTSFDMLLPAAYRDVRLRRWHGDGLAIVGDAGHAMSPQLGQGANLALMDAAALADTVSAGRGLTAYTRARRLHLRYYTLASWALNAVFQHDREALAWPRDHLITPAARVPPLRRLMLGTLTGRPLGGR